MKSLRDAEASSDLSDQMEELLREVDRLRSDNQQLRHRLSEVSTAKDNQIEALQHECEALRSTVQEKDNSGSELTRRLQMLERMYYSTRSELRDAQSEAEHLRAAKVSDSGVLTRFEVSKTPLQRRHVAEDPSTAESVDMWSRSLRGGNTEAARRRRSPRSKSASDDSPSMSLLWSVHDDLKGRIDELIQACMTGNVFDAAGEDVVKERILEHVQRVNAEYSTAVLSSLQACHSRIDSVLTGLDVDGNSENLERGEGGE